MFVYLCVHQEETKICAHTALVAARSPWLRDKIRKARSQVGAFCEQRQTALVNSQISVTQNSLTGCSMMLKKAFYDGHKRSRPCQLFALVWSPATVSPSFLFVEYNSFQALDMKP